MKEPKILYYDIETSLTVLGSWGLYNQYHSPDNIIEDWYIICAAWKWDGKDHVHSVKMGKDDKEVVKALHKTISEADCIVAHNGDKFDLKKFNTRAIFYGLKPIPKVKTVDTLKIAKRHFSFSSNKLDYIAKYLGLSRKIKAPFDLWMKTLQGDRKAIEELRVYCKQDIVVLEKVHKKLEVYDKPAINKALYYGEEICPKCASDNWKFDGYRYTEAGKFRRYECHDCKKQWQDSRSSAKTRFK